MADGLWRIWSIGSSRDQRILFTNTMSMKVKNAASHRPEFAKLVEPFKPEATEPGTSQRSGILFPLTCHTRLFDPPIRKEFADRQQLVNESAIHRSGRFCRRGRVWIVEG